MDDFGTWFAPYEYFQQPDFLQAMENFQMDAFPVPDVLVPDMIFPDGSYPGGPFDSMPFPDGLALPEIASSVEANYDTPTSSDGSFEAIDTISQSQKRRQTSSPCESDSLVRSRKTRKLRAPEQTAKVREKGACYLCQLKRKECQDAGNPDGSCQRCLEHAKSISIVPGLLRPVCWRPNIGYTEIFRRGPTIDLAASVRGNSEDEEPGKQAVWKHFATRRSGNETTKLVELSQNWTSSTLKIPLDRYQPKEGDRQHYSWYNNGVEEHYNTPAYGIANLHVVRSAIEKFLEENFTAYIEAHMRKASDITKKTFKLAQEHKHRLPLVERALKLWVCCRFIEEPWSIVGFETLGLSRDKNPNCPYNDRIPVPPIVDLQIDLIVINELLKPELKIILKMMKTMLESSKLWTNWFEVYLAYFILLSNVELTMAHDLWFVKRNNLKKRYSNKALVDTITQGANTLLTCYHYGHQGYAPFSNPELENTQKWSNTETTYLESMRPLLRNLRGDHVNDPAKELFWTSQLHKADWRPVVLVC